MSRKIDRIKYPELFFGFVAPIGADLARTLDAFRLYFENRGYSVVEIKITDIFPAFEPYAPPKLPLQKKPLKERYKTYIEYGNELRSRFGDDTLAISAIGRIVRQRLRQKREREDQFSKTVFLIHQFKRKEEIDLMRSVYGRLFFQVSIYSRRGSRVEYLSRSFASSQNSSSAQSFRSDAELLIQSDENQSDQLHGQRVGKIFHDADLIISLDDREFDEESQVRRFCDLLFWSNSISPTRMEYGHFLAKAAALRSLDLSRQVGAAIFSDKGEIIALGSNEVPRAGGGSYWSNERFDDREFKRGIDSNDKRKRERLAEIIELTHDKSDLSEILSMKALRESQFMDALEYGRIVHAEMSAISDAARTGRVVESATLYCTTFPCHMCAKHIIAAGIAKVVFLEPYPKSLASELHCDALEIEGEDRGGYASFPSVKFQHFHGITHRRYRELFERERRKNEQGEFLPFGDASTGSEPVPVLDIKYPFYTKLEEMVLERAADDLISAIDER